jgi:anaerobic selenocysteine-containing dehydrogenase
MDPRRSESADYADIHLAVKPGRDAWALTAILAHIIQQNKLPMDWLAEHTNGFEEVIAHISDIDVAAYAEFAGLTTEQIQETADTIAGAESFALEEDIGIQMAPHSTLVSYLNMLVQLMTGNFGREGTMGLPVQLVSVLSPDRAKLDENGYEIERKTLPVTGAPIVSGLAPCNSIADEILNEDDRRLRAMIIESANPVHSLAESDKMRRAIRALDISISIDVAFTETARECDYILPASSQFEKWEATTFPRSYPANYFHLRPPIFEPAPNTLTEPEIHARLIEALGAMDESDLAPLHEAAKKDMAAYRDALIEGMMTNPKIKNMISYVLYRTLPPLLPEGAESTAAFFGLAQIFTMQYPKEAARAGFSGPDGGNDLFNKLISSPSGAIIGEASNEDSFQRLPFKDKKLRLVIKELLDELDTLRDLQPLVDTSEEFPFSLAAGERRAYTANTNIRDPQWAKGRNVTAISINPADAESLGLEDGAAVVLETAHGKAEGVIGFDERMRPGTLSVPNGQGMDYPDEDGELQRFGVYANELTGTEHKDKFIYTPLHKFVPARIRAA